jgi:hypothetical protein
LSATETGGLLVQRTIQLKARIERKGENNLHAIISFF